MSDITPPSGNAPPTGVVNPNDPNADTTSTTFDTNTTITDTLSSSGGPALALAPLSDPQQGSFYITLSPPDLTIIGYTSAIGDRFLKQQETENESITQDQTLYDKLLQPDILSAQYLRNLHNYLSSSSAQWIAVTNAENNAINTMNAATTAYTNAVTSTEPSPGQDAAETQAMNNAIDTYNNQAVPDDAAFNTAANAYNAYVNGRNATLASAQATYNAAVANYNSQVDANNAQIAQLNAGRATVGLPPIPLQTHVDPAQPYPLQALAPLTRPVPNLPTPTLPPQIPPVVGPTSEAQIFQQYYKPAAKYAKAQIKKFKKYAAQIGFNLDWKNYQDFYLKRGLLSAQPSAYIFRSPQPTTDALGGTGVSPAGSGVSLATITLAPDSRNVLAALSYMTWSEQANRNATPISGLDGPAFETAGFNIPGKLGLIGGKNAKELLKDKMSFLDFGSSPVTLALNLGNIKAISDIIKSGVLDSLENSATVKLQLLLTGLLDTSATVGAPGLTAQVLGLAAGTDVVKGILNGGNAVTAAQDNPIALATAKQIASDIIQRGNNQYDRDQADQIANDALNSVFLQQDLDAASVHDELVSAFQAQAVAEDDALNAAGQAKAYLEQELGANLLNNQISRNLVDANVIARTIQNQAVIKQLTLNAAQLKSDITNNVIAQNIQTYRDLRDTIAQTLVLQGIEQDNSRILANNAVLAISGSNPLQITQPGLQVQLTSDQIAANLTSLVVDALKSSVGLAAARDSAGQLVAAVTGTQTTSEEINTPNSLLYQIQQQIQEIQASKAEIAFSTIENALTAFVKPSLPAIQIAHDMNVSARTYLKTQWTGVMYKEDVPSNYKQSVDTPI